MNLKEIGRFDYGVGRKEFHEDYTFIILESRDKKHELWEYWVTLEGYGLILGVFGMKERETAKAVFDYLCLDGLRHYLNHFNGIEEEEEEE